MTAIQAIYIALILLVIPFLTGSCFAKKGENAVLCVIMGLMIDWVLFYICAVPYVIGGKKLSQLLTVYEIVVLLAAVSGGILGALKFFHNRKHTDLQKSVAKEISAIKGYELFYLLLFIALVVFQVYMSIAYAFNDGDDAYYVAVSQIADGSDTMYVLDAYTGFSSGIVLRYALAPFPIWIACIARFTGVNAAAVAHSVVSPFIIIISYVIYWEISKLIYKDNREKRFMFLCIYAFFAVFSNVSTAVQETFLLTRSRQGKACLAGVVVPFMIYLFLRLLRKHESANAQRVAVYECISLFITCAAAALMSIFGNALAVMMVFFILVFAFVRKWPWIERILIAMSAVPAMLVILAYIVY